MPQAEDLPWRGASGAHRGTRARGAAAAISRHGLRPGRPRGWRGSDHSTWFGASGGLLGIFGSAAPARASDPVSPAGEVCGVQPRGVADYVAWCACASVVIARLAVSHCVRTAGAGWVRRSARTLPVGRVVVYARVVVCEDYLTNTLINTQRGVSPSPLARGSERVKHTISPREHTHRRPCAVHGQRSRVVRLSPQARTDPSCAPCAYARKHMKLLTSYSSTLRHNTARGQRPRPSGWRCCRQGPDGEAVNDPLYEAWNCRQRCGLRAKVSRLEGGRAVGREGRGAGDPPLERRLLSDILTCVFDLW